MSYQYRGRALYSALLALPLATVAYLAWSGGLQDWWHAVSHLGTGYSATFVNPIAAMTASLLPLWLSAWTIGATLTGDHPKQHATWVGLGEVLRRAAGTAMLDAPTAAQLPPPDRPFVAATVGFFSAAVFCAVLARIPLPVWTDRFRIWLGGVALLVWSETYATYARDRICRTRHTDGTLSDSGS